MKLFSEHISRSALAAAIGLIFGAGVIASNATIAQADTVDVSTLRVDVFGTGPAVQAEVVQAVRDLIAKGFADSTIESVVTLGYGIEGGFSACINRYQWAAPHALADLGVLIGRIQRDASRTALTVEFSANCFNWESGR